MRAARGTDLLVLYVSRLEKNKREKEKEKKTNKQTNKSERLLSHWAIFRWKKKKPAAQ